MEQLSENQSPHAEKTTVWHRHITAWQSSDLSQTQYCKQENINYIQFGYWRSKFLAKERKSDQKKLLPVQLRSTSHQAFLRIRLLNHAMIEIPVNMPYADLAFIFKSLGLVP